MDYSSLSAKQLANVMYDSIPYQHGVLILNEKGRILEARLTERIKQKGINWQNRFFEDLEFLIKLFHSCGGYGGDEEDVLNINGELVSIKALDTHQILVVILDKKVKEI